MIQLYKITNKIDNKSYIGQTRNSLKRRWNAHCSKRSTCRYLKNAIERHGRDNFEIVVLEEVMCPIVADYREKILIESHQTIAPDGYNLKSGGAGYSATKAIGQKGKISPFKGKIHSEKSKALMSKAKKGWTGNQTTFKVRPVICLTTGKTYPSTSQAAKDEVVSHAAVTLACQGKRKNPKKAFAYLEEKS
jgi:group I intron endonuclease